MNLGRNDAKVKSMERSVVKKTKLFLHIGHGKTGTSAIQSALAIAAEDLSKTGTYYPISKSLRDKASHLEITSGNWKAQPESTLSEQLIKLTQDNQHYSKIVLSSESLFWLISDFIKDKDAWDEYIDIHLILAVREIDEMLSSEYQQRVKRHGDCIPLGQFLRRRNFISSHHVKAAETISLMHQYNVKHTLINYSKHKQDISRLLFKVIGSEEKYPEAQMKDAIVNRSLSRKELETLTTINALYAKKFPWISTRISDALITNQPKLKSQQCKITTQHLKKIYETNDAYIQAINKFLGPTEKLNSLLNFSQESEKQINSPQNQKKAREEEIISIDLIGEALKQVLSNESQQKLSNDTIDAIIELSQSGRVSKETEIELLQLAKQNRPKALKLSQLLEHATKEFLKD